MFEQVYLCSVFLIGLEYVSIHRDSKLNSNNNNSEALTLEDSMRCLKSSLVVFDTFMSLNIPSSLEVN